MFAITNAEVVFLVVFFVVFFMFESFLTAMRIIEKHEWHERNKANQSNQKAADWTPDVESQAPAATPDDSESADKH